MSDSGPIGLSGAQPSEGIVLLSLSWFLPFAARFSERQEVVCLPRHTSFWDAFLTSSRVFSPASVRMDPLFFSLSFDPMSGPRFPGVLPFRTPF